MREGNGGGERGNCGVYCVLTVMLRWVEECCLHGMLCMFIGYGMTCVLVSYVCVCFWMGSELVSDPNNYFI